MDDGTFITFSVEFKPGIGESFVANITEDLKVTRDFAGCRSVEAYRSGANPDQFMILEHWDSAQAYDTYFKWREESGAMDELVPMLAKPPEKAIWAAVA